MLNKTFLQNLVGPDTEILGFWQLSLYDHDMDVLYLELRDWLQLRFGGQAAIFQPHQRLVFLHDDTDFWLSPDSVPFTLYNLQLILHRLDISNCFCRVITNMPDYEPFAERVCGLLTNDNPIPVVSGNLVNGCLVEDPDRSRPDRPYSTDIDEIQSSYDLIEWTFMVASRTRRHHRILFMSELLHRGLSNCGLISYHNVSSQTVDLDSSIMRSDKSDSGLHLLSVKHAPRQNSHLMLRDHDVNQRYLAFESCPEFYHPHKNQLPPRIQATLWKHQEIQKALIYVSMETTVTLPRPFVTRITMKAMVNWRPFVVLGSPGTLEFLRDLGFRTFHDFWDERYDQETDLVKRTHLILDVLQEQSRLSPAARVRQLQSLEPVLAYNRAHYTTTFGQQQLLSLAQGLK